MGVAGIAGELKGLRALLRGRPRLPRVPELARNWLAPENAAKRMLGTPEGPYGERALSDLRGAVVDATCDWLWAYYDPGRQPSDGYFIDGVEYYMSELGSPSKNQAEALAERFNTLKLAVSGWEGAQRAGRELLCYFAGG